LLLREKPDNAAPFTYPFRNLQIREQFNKTEAMKAPLDQQMG
jgi:hypothetical protein